MPTDPQPQNPMAALLAPILANAQTKLDESNKAAQARHAEVMDLLGKIYDLLNIEE